MEETEMAQPDEGKEAPDRETTSLPESFVPESSVPTATPTMQLPTIETNGQPRMSNTPVNNQDLQDPDNAPRVGMCFQSEEEAYQFYNSYAQTKGFSIRKCHLKYRADQSICSRYFVCNKAGVKTSNPTRVAKKEQAISRTNCMARVQFSITPKGIWSAQKVMLDHNHQLVSPDKRHMLRSQRQLLDADRHMIKQMRTSGIKQAEIYDFCELWYGKDAIPFLQMDCNNYLPSERSESSSEMTEYVAKTTVPFRAPERIKGSKQKRSKDVLEGAKKSKKKGKGTNYPAKESVFVPSAAGPSEFDFAGALNPSIAMAFGEYPSFLGPPIQGEFTRLLLEAHGDGTTPPAARQLDFNDGASTSRFQPR